MSSYCNKWENTPISFIPKTTITYTGGSSCIAPTGLTASNVTAEGATISWNDNGAESYNLDVNGTVYENVTNPYILDVELSTTYTVKVQAVCGEDETSAWSSGINFTTPDCWVGHTINYTLNDSYGDGWNNANLTIVDKSNNNTIKTLTISSGGTESGSLTLCNGTYDFVWHTGSYDSECSFSISENGETLFTCSNAYDYTNGQVVYTLDLLEKFSITLTQPSEEFGTISADLEEATAGTTVTLSADFNLGYALNYFMVDGVQIEGNTFEMPEHDVTVSVAYNTLTQYAINCAELAEGAIHAEYDGETITEAPAGTEVILVAEPNTGYTLDHFVVDDEPLTGNTFTMPSAAVNVSAVFSTVYSITVDPQLVGGTITYTDLTSATAFAAGTTVYLTPEAYTDYVFVENSIVATRVNDGETVAVSYNPNIGAYYIEMPASDVTVTATFNEIPYYEVSQVTSPINSGYYNVSKTSHIEEGEQIVISNIYPQTGYEFASVVVTRDDTEAAVTTTAYYGSYYFNMPASDVTITVNFNALPRYSVSVGEVVNGTITLDESYQNILAGTTVYLEANPATDYVLQSLTVTPEEGESFEPTHQYGNSYYFEMPSSNVTISATFRQLQSYTINYYVNGELDRTMQCQEDRFVNNDGPQNVAVPAGVTFEGWGVAEIGTYTTEKPAILGNAKKPTQNYDLYAVLSYSEQIPATSKDGDKWVEVTSPSDLSNGDQVIIVKKSSNYVMCDRSSSGSGEFDKAAISISSNEITSLPSNAVILTAIDNSGNWKFSFIDAHSGASTLADYFGSYLVPVNIWGGCDTWTIEQDGSSVYLRDTQFNANLSFSGGYFTCSQYTGSQAQLFKKYNPFITNTYYMTEVLTEGTVGDYSAKNIILDQYRQIFVSGTLELDANGLFRNTGTDNDNFTFEDGAQFIYRGTETINARFFKEIKAYSDPEGRDGYYLVANPTDHADMSEWTFTLFDFDLYTFEGDQELEWVNQRAIQNINFNRGTGYLFACAEDETLPFIGALIPAGSMDVALDFYTGTEPGRDFPGFNLIGNPYACNAYVLYDEAGMSTYRLDKDGKELVAVEPGTPIAPCEGFFVEAEAYGQTVVITTEESEVESSALSLTVSQNRGSVIDRAIISFNGSGNLHKFMLNPSHTNLSIAKDGETFAAVSSETKGELPVSFKAETTGTYTISVNTENVTAGYIHLIDNMTGTDVDLLATPSYSFIGSPRDNENRFTVKFEVSDNTNLDNDDNFVYQYGNELIIDGEGTLQMFDVLGRVVISEEVHGQRVDVSNLTKGAYIVRMTGENVRTQKIVVK